MTVPSRTRESRQTGHETQTASRTALFAASVTAGACLFTKANSHRTTTGPGAAGAKPKAGFLVARSGQSLPWRGCCVSPGPSAVATLLPGKRNGHITEPWPDGLGEEALTSSPPERRRVSQSPSFSLQMQAGLLPTQQPPSRLWDSVDTVVPSPESICGISELKRTFRSQLVQSLWSSFFFFFFFQNQS